MNSTLPHNFLREFPTPQYSNPTILIDMDNTIVDYSSSIACALQAIYPDENITPDNWQLLELNDLHFNRREIQAQSGFFLNLKPITGALEAIKEMDKEGYNVFIVSSPSVLGKYCHSEKCAWMKQHMGEKWAKKLVLTKDKTIIHGNLLIDDKPYITGAIKDPSWTHITYTQPYNTSLDDKDTRTYLNDWSQWRSVITKFNNI